MTPSGIMGGDIFIIASTAIAWPLLRGLTGISVRGG